MNLNFFKHKMKEVKSFLKLVTGKAVNNEELKEEGAQEALSAMNQERKHYESELTPKVKKTKHRPKIKRDQSNGRDISAI